MAKFVSKTISSFALQTSPHCLGSATQHRTNPICVTLPKEAKATMGGYFVSMSLKAQYHIQHRHLFNWTAKRPALLAVLIL
jgi:hypothetical protein